MLDCWTGIDFLLVLQDIRVTVPQFINDFLLFISSKWFYRIIPLLLFFWIFWFVDKKKAEYCLLNFSFVSSLTQMFKFYIKQPRPHVLNPEIEPVKIETSYSTPSSHTSLATSGFGSIALVMRKWWITVIAVVLIVVIMFSRMWLGAHTPLDIITGFLLAVAVMAINWYLFKWSYESDRNYYLIGAGYIVAYVIISIVILCCIDHHSYFAYYTIGFSGAYLVGRLIEHRYIGFEVRKNTAKNIIILMIIGYLVTIVVGEILYYVDTPFASTASGVIICAWCTLILPYLMQNRISFFSKLIPEH